MSVLECKYCGARAEAASFEEADALIDHSIGLYKSNGCPGDDKDLYWNGKPAFEVTYTRTSTGKTKSGSKTKKS
jgi:hypothetical protein